MNIKLITYNRTRNYGGILQAYGLYRYLELQGYNVAFIDYIPRRCNINDKMAFIDEATKKSKLWGRNALTRWLFYVIRYPKMKKTYESFIEFMNEKTKFTQSYYSEEELELSPPVADIFITGSDQVWNSQFSVEQKLDLPFYLPFVKTGKKISYASSFGKDTIPDDHKAKVKEMIGQYCAVSVREKSGSRILSELGIDSTVVVDPTILCPVEEWNKIVSIQLAKNYILMYQVTFSIQIYNMAKSVAEKAGKTLITISLDGKCRKIIKEGLVVASSIEDWLSYIKYADGVITDSFHASVFSILFRTRFIVNSGTRKGMSTRISNLLEMAGLEERNVNSFDLCECIDALNKEINWSACMNRLNSLRRMSISWFNNAIESL